MPVAVLIVLLAFLAPAEPPGFTRSDARHLLDRAGFGGTPAQIERFAALGRAGAVDMLLASGTFETFSAEQKRLRARAIEDGADAAAIQETRRAMRRDDRLQLEEYRDFWLRTMAETQDPLREKMALFWHGTLTSSFREVRDSYFMIRQIELYRRAGRGSFRELLHAASKEPAMLAYLDNDKNRKGKPNENFAREVMELFTLGPGHYAEHDIHEAARAFTGWAYRDGEFFLRRRLHDAGPKTFLGKTGNLDGDDVLDILLEQDACAPFVTRKVYAFFVRPDPDEQEIARLARIFRASDYDVTALLRAIFMSDAFYARDARAAQFKSPVEFVVSTVRRLGISPPPAPFLAAATEQLGQAVLFPPNVKGWEGQEAWINTASILQRANVARVLVLGVPPRRAPRDERNDVAAMDDDADGAMSNQDGVGLARGAGGGIYGRALRRLRRWKPDLDALAIVGDARTSRAAVTRVCDRFLPVAPLESTVAELREFLAPDGDDAFSLQDPETRERVPELVHLVLSLPEYQLN